MAGDYTIFMSVTTPLNALSRASSSYLRSAMHQPIHWHEWGDEAFELARRENRAILLDIGAVWCHWCHVMDRESYEDPEIAQIVNERFVAIKVDRDERPDVDSRYQIAVQAISGQGGWPLTAFLTSDGKPFYGGTYFPRQDHYGRPSFRRVLLAISDAYLEKHEDVAEQAKLVESAITNSESFAAKPGEFSANVVAEIVDAALKMFDEQHGGFGSAPKFPHPSMIDLLIGRYVAQKSDSQAETASARLQSVFAGTLEKMAKGGVYDQLAGGFHRYSVDERWIVPHFEKMSYDNSELLKNYVHAFQATGNQFFAHVARDIIRWMDDVLSDRELGGFYASQDADISLDDDGDYFTWTVDETKVVLTTEEAQAACLHYDINEIGEMHHNPAKNVLYQRAPVSEIAARLGLSTGQVEGLLRSSKRKMHAARLNRPTPYIDKTIYVSWNALCVSAYLESARALQFEDARRFALRSLDRILSEAWDSEQGLKHVVAYSQGNAAHAGNVGFLDDYTYLSIACLDAYETTSDITYFRKAHDLIDHMNERFYDATGGGFLDSPSKGDNLGVLNTPRKPFQDSPTPAGNSAAIIALLRMFDYTDDVQYREKAERTLQLFAGVAGQYGIFAATYGIAAVHFTTERNQIVIVGEDEKALQLYKEAVSCFHNSVLKLSFNQAVLANLPPAIGQSIPQLPAVQQRKTCAVVCSGRSCKPPVYEVEDLRKLLRNQKAAA